MSRTRIALVALTAGLTFTGSAAGFVVGRVFKVHPAQRADFVDLKRSAWQCSNLKTYVTCQSGDAFPYVKLGGGTCPAAV